MMLTEVSAVALAVLPVQALKDHLRLGTGFSDGAMQDGLLASYLRAALAAIEGRTGKAILQRRFKLVLPAWRSDAEQAPRLRRCRPDLQTPRCRPRQQAQSQARGTATLR